MLKLKLDKECQEKLEAFKKHTGMTDKQAIEFLIHYYYKVEAACL